ncbi:MAG: cell filamentation protein Fic, partial [Planctomycetota bacterium]
MLEIPENAIPTGYSALKEKFKLKALPHFRLSYVLQKGGQKTIVEQGQEIHFYPKKYQPKDPENIFSQLEFALKYDGIHLGILESVFEQIPPEQMTSFVKEHPSSKTGRRLWYLYEFLLGKKLDVKDIQGGSYVLLLDPQDYYTGKNIRSRRHYVDDNLLGNIHFCPFIRRTSVLASDEKIDFKEIAKDILKKYDPEIIFRATNYLYLKET